MLPVIQSVLPVFLLILAGWLLVSLGYIQASTGRVLSQFIFRVAVPVLLFRTLAEADFRGVLPLRLWIAYFSGVIVVWLIAHLWITHIVKLDHRFAAIGGISAAFGNTVFIGLPLLDRIIGPEGLVAFSVLIVVHQPALMITATVLIERSTDQATLTDLKTNVVRILARSLWGNPLVYGTVGGILYQTMGFSLSGMGKGIVDQIASLAGPGALLSLGMAMHGYKLAGNLRLSIGIMLLKLFVMPSVVLIVAPMIDLRWSWTAALVLIASVPTGVNAWLIAAQFRIGEEAAASSIAVTTILGVFGVTFWAWLLS